MYCWLHTYHIIIIIIIKIYTALIDIETYNQSVKVSACEGIDRYTYTYIYTNMHSFINSTDTLETPSPKATVLAVFWNVTSAAM